MKKTFALLLIICLFGWACQKEDPVPDCEKNNTGELQILNLKNNTYELYVDTTYISEIKPNETKLFTYPTGNCMVKFWTKDGYYWFKVNVERCELTRVTFKY